MTKTKYHVKDYCNKCGANANIIDVVESIDGYICDCDTSCKSCGFKDQWSYGFFRSSQEIEGKCKTYTN